MSDPGSQPNQRGSILVQFALVVVAVFAVAALTIDVGLAFLTQGQMQAAVDAAAYEGVALRDAEPDVAVRRAAVAAVASRQFDETLSAADDDLRLGAGSQVTLSGGETSLLANRQLDVPADPFYRPTLQSNLSNAEYGDMVSGTFVEGVDSEESLIYGRDDFLPAVTAEVDSGAFLVRMRRTRDAQGLDNVVGVSSSAGPLPVLFGSGSVIGPVSEGDPGLRGGGITVRATAIADARRAAAVGAPVASLALEGRAPFGLDVEFWNGLTTDQATTVEVGPDGTIDCSVCPILPAGSVPGRFLNGGFSVGEAIVPVAPGVVTSEERFVPIYTRVGGVERVIGFGTATLVAQGVLPGPATLIRLETVVAPWNVSARPDEGLVGLDPTAVDAVLVAHRSFEEPLLSAARVR